MLFGSYFEVGSLPPFPVLPSLLQLVMSKLNKSAADIMKIKFFMILILKQGFKTGAREF